MSWEYILLDKRDRVATVTLNRPERMNAFAGLMRQEIVAARSERLGTWRPDRHNCADASRHLYASRSESSTRAHDPSPRNGDTCVISIAQTI